MVLPVPDRPKNIAESFSFPTLTEQCIGITFLGGKRKFNIVNTDFLISPAYDVPAIKTTFLAKLTAMIVSEREPCRFGSALKLGKSIIINSGSKADFSSSFTVINKF